MKGQGRELGLQLRAWHEADTPGLTNGKVMANRLVDLLGAEEGLKGPVRDLAGQPLFLRALSDSGAGRETSVRLLAQQLGSTYAPAVLVELLDLLEAATGVAVSLAQDPKANAPFSTPRVAQDPWGLALRESLQAMGPGLAVAAGAALVLRWLSGELDHWLFKSWDWQGWLVLALTLALLQALSLGPLKRARRQWPLEQADATEPRQAWRWISAPWMHHSHGEAVVNVLLLLLILRAPSPLPLPDVVLRYMLTSLATTALALLVAMRRTSERRWDGAAGAVSALIGLAAASSLVHWRSLAFSLGPIEIPAWVLLLVYGALQLGWQLPRQSEHDESRPLDRLLSSQWWWGLVLGVGWAVYSRLETLLQLALRARDSGA
ncbi:rhomboid family intramembrane serine protease [Synechococcus sp. CS-205]|uniref:rhomboid family intramembrane serine protease n=1 Tax=Synechococcus sp. CS-205 TaxID=2847984 RepID=UPI0021E22CC8|nr:rhomboid family intramembrane serine protease [Synechococcus sp. CS-205]MCT0249493.1 rhomboid family intramembrane serine protease [Synechococcus sp. CS-205]